MASQPALSSFIWAVADLLRGDYKQSDYGKVILPFTVLRRLDCVLDSTKPAVLAELAAKEKLGVNPAPFLSRITGRQFFNASPLDLKKLLGDPTHVATNLFAYIQGFSPEVRDIFEHFEFQTQIERLSKAGLLYQVTEKFCQIDLHPDKVSNADMGTVFEELIRKFAELSNETAGEHFTPREVIRLMVNLLFVEDDEVLAKPGVVRTLYDPTAGTGGMLSVAGEYLHEHNPKASLAVYGQELNPESYAICKADMLIKGQDVANIVFGNTLSDDGHPTKTFDYMLSNPPFGVEWKKVEREVRKEHQDKGFAGRFGPGLPRVSDGSMLFLLHLISKMRPATEGGSRFGIVLNGSPLFTGGAGSGESEIRRYVLENDLLEAIVGLPTDMFYNTGIATYVWILSNRKPAARKGKVQLIDASGMWQKMRKSLGQKRKELSDAHIDRITRLFGHFEEASDHDADGSAKPIRASVEELPRLVQMFLTALAVDKGYGLDEDTQMGDISIDAILRTVTEHINEQGSRRNLDFIGPDRRDLITSEVSLDGIVGQALSDADLLSDRMSGYVDALIQANAAEFAELGQTLLDDYWELISEDMEDCTYAGPLLDSFEGQIKTLLLEQDIMPAIEQAAAEVVDLLDS